MRWALAPLTVQPQLSVAKTADWPSPNKYNDLIPELGSLLKELGLLSRNVLLH